jgi:hypothetical protein
LYDPADDLLIVPLPDLILGLAVFLLGAERPLDAMYPLPERLTAPDALAALIPVARDVRFLLPLLLTVPLPDLILGLALRFFPYEPADDLLIVPLPDLILGFLLVFDLAEPTLAVLVPLFVVTLTIVRRSCNDF